MLIEDAPKYGNDDEYKTAARQRLENLMVLCFLFPDRSKITMAQREFSVATIVTRPKKREEPNLGSLFFPFSFVRTYVRPPTSW